MPYARPAIAWKKALEGMTGSLRRGQGMLRGRDWGPDDHRPRSVSSAAGVGVPFLALARLPPSVRTRLHTDVERLRPRPVFCAHALAVTLPAFVVTIERCPCFCGRGLLLLSLWNSR